MSSAAGSDVPLLSLQELTMSFAARRGADNEPRSRERQVLHSVSLDVHGGEVVALVGESGCGKTTTAQLALRLLRPASGRVVFEGRDITTLTRRQLRPLRTRMQMIYQDPYESLNPRHRVSDLLIEPLSIHKRLGATRAIREERIARALESVGLTPVEEFRERYPHELSGGQRQRVAIASSLMLEPRLLVADEPVSMLDVSVRAGILSLLVALKADFGLGILFITHDLATAACCADVIAVMYRGRIVELGPAELVISSPRHPYTHDLIAAVPKRIPSTELSVSAPEIAVDRASEDQAGGCPYAARCRFVEERCLSWTPNLRQLSDEASARTVACLRAEEIAE